MYKFIGGVVVEYVFFYIFFVYMVFWVDLNIWVNYDDGVKVLIMQVFDYFCWFGEMFFILGEVVVVVQIVDIQIDGVVGDLLVLEFFCDFIDLFFWVIVLVVLVKIQCLYGGYFWVASQLGIVLSNICEFGAGDKEIVYFFIICFKQNFFIIGLGKVKVCMVRIVQKDFIIFFFLKFEEKRNGLVKWVGVFFVIKGVGILVLQLLFVEVKGFIFIVQFVVGGFRGCFLGNVYLFYVVKDVFFVGIGGSVFIEQGVIGIIIYGDFKFVFSDLVNQVVGVQGKMFFFFIKGEVW